MKSKTLVKSNKYPIYSIVLWALILLVFSCFEEPKSSIPEREAKAVQRILETNGFTINDMYSVDDYIDWINFG